MLAIEQIYQLLTANSALSERLPGGIHTIWVIDGDFPRLIITLDCTSSAGPMAVGVLTLDLFYRGNQVLWAHQTRRIIDGVLESHGFDNDDLGAMRINFGRYQDGPSDDPEIGHLVISYNIRGGRISPQQQEE